MCRTDVSASWPRGRHRDLGQGALQFRENSDTCLSRRLVGLTKKASVASNSIRRRTYADIRIAYHPTISTLQAIYSSPIQDCTPIEQYQRNVRLTSVYKFQRRTALTLPPATVVLGGPLGFHSAVTSSESEKSSSSSIRLDLKLLLPSACTVSKQGTVHTYAWVAHPPASVPARWGCSTCVLEIRFIVMHNRTDRQTLHRQVSCRTSLHSVVKWYACRDGRW